MFSDFFTAAQDKSADEAASLLESNTALESAHGETVQAGQSAVEEDTWNHFTCFVAKGDHLYELDGRRESPVNRGPTSAATFLKDAVACVKRDYMDSDPEEVGFTLLALAKNPAEEAE
jgi:ubiquitin carboxyl-terminal hydrolase L3